MGRDFFIPPQLLLNVIQFASKYWNQVWILSGFFSGKELANISNFPLVFIFLYLFMSLKYKLHTFLFYIMIIMAHFMIYNLLELDFPIFISRKSLWYQKQLWCEHLCSIQNVTLQKILKINQKFWTCLQSQAWGGWHKRVMISRPSWII